MANQSFNIIENLNGYFSSSKPVIKYILERYIGRCIRPVSVGNSKIGGDTGFVPYNWDQGNPFNDLLPIDPTHNYTSLAGCPTIAVAMTLNYFANKLNYRTGVSNLINYTSEKNGVIIDVIDAESLPDVDEFNYDLLDSNNYMDFMHDEDKKAEVSKFIKYIAYALQI